MTNDEILQQLVTINIDTKTALTRFLDNKEMYIKFIKNFPKDKSYKTLTLYLEDKNWKEVFEIAHSLKGVTGNLGMTSLFEGFSKMVEAYRNKQYTDIENIFLQTNQEYKKICTQIANF